MDRISKLLAVLNKFSSSVILPNKLLLKIVSFLSNEDIFKSLNKTILFNSLKAALNQQLY